MRLAARLCPDLLGSYSAPPSPLAVIREGEGRGRKGFGIRGEEEDGREGNDVKG